MVPVHEMSVACPLSMTGFRPKLNQLSCGIWSVSYRQEGRDTRLRGKQIVAGRVDVAGLGVGADGEQLTPAVIEEPKIHLAHQAVGVG